LPGPAVAVALILICVAGLLATGVCAIVLARSKFATPIVYGAACTASTAALVIALAQVIAAPHETPAVILPLGLPWLGAHFRIDALSALFLVIVNLGGAAASLYGIGYGRHESAPARVLPFFPAFLAGMNLVVMADDAFSFLLSWEFMSLVSWALVMAHHRDAENTRAG
jgi:hydrogenase-4 component B